MLNRLFRKTCTQCLQISDAKINLCTDCIENLPWLEITTLCQRCAIPLSDIYAGVCGQCIKSPPVFARAFAVLDYTRMTAKFLHQFKFNHHLHYGQLLAMLLLKWGQQHPFIFEDSEAIMPVPLHFWRGVRRGFNQSVQLAKPLARDLQLPIDAHSILKSRHTKTQHTLDIKARKKNMQNAFHVRKPLPYAHITLIDDVMTTGETIRALATCIKKHQPTITIDVVCLLRACGKLTQPT